MAVKKHFSLPGSNSTVISWIFYEKAEQKSLLKTNKQNQQKTKQTTSCCCQVRVTHKPRDYRAWPRCTWEDSSWHLPCTIREFLLPCCYYPGGRMGKGKGYTTSSHSAEDVQLRRRDVPNQKVRTGRNMILKLSDGSLTWMKKNRLQSLPQGL